MGQAVSTAVSAGLIDTNVVIHLAALAPEELPNVPHVSAITIAELSVGPLVAKSEAERAVRQRHLQQVEADMTPLPVDTSVARAFGPVAADMRRAGRKPSARSFDALIAATAIANGLPLFTCNPADFAGIAGLDVRAVTPPARRP
jgi:hypothetical protein